MNLRFRPLAALVATTGLVGSALVAAAGAQGEPPSPRPGLTAQQTKRAVELAKGAMRELRVKTEGAADRDADPREYVVNVEFLPRKQDGPSAAGGPSKTTAATKADGPRAVVTSYRYFDDITVFSTVDLSTGRVVDVQAAQHVPTPLSDSEFEDAVAVAREKSDEVKKLYHQFGDQLKVYPQFSQFTVKDDPRLHRVVHLNYRIGKRDLSYPRPQVDLTSGEIQTPAPVPGPQRPARKRTTDRP
jgi:hypothetical protein